MGRAARLELALDSRLEELPRLAEALDAFRQEHALPAESAFHFDLCFDEVITNIITHGLNGAPGHAIFVSLNLRNGWLRGEIVDDGPPFDPLDAAPPDLAADVEERPIGGLGTHFVRTLMDEVSYCRRDDQNRLAFAKRLAGPPTSEKK